jgi:hypothetical protein
MKKFGVVEGNILSPFAINLEKSEELLKLLKEFFLPPKKDLRDQHKGLNTADAVDSDTRDANGTGNNNNDDDDNDDNSDDNDSNGGEVENNIIVPADANSALITDMPNAELKNDEDDAEIDDKEGGSNDEFEPFSCSGDSHKFFLSLRISFRMVTEIKWR